MKTTTKTRLAYCFATALLGSAIAACGGTEVTGEGDEGAYLTIVGDHEVTLDYGVQHTLRVRYHDADDQPLAGEIAFATAGESMGSELDSTVVATDDDGVVEVVLTSGDEPGTFDIQARADLASAAEWRINIAGGSQARDMSGTYALDSSFDLAGPMPGTVGNVLNTIIDMTDDPYDPATWLIEEIDNAALNSVKGLVEPVLYELIQSQAPSLVPDLLAIANDLGEVMRHYGITSQLVVTGGDPIEGTGYVATHTVTGFAFEVDGQRAVYLMEELGVERPMASSVGVTYAGETNRATVAEHAITIPYGGAVALALEDLIIPLIDPSAYGLEDILASAIDCYAFGDIAAEKIGFGSPATYTSLCNTGISSASNYVMDQIRNIDELAPVTLNIHGDAVAKDSTGDLVVDELVRGQWQGTVDYAGSAAELSSDGDVNNFRGERMQ